jgi:hypothetical protein
MEEFLPFIIAIIWLLYTFYTKGQKRKSATQRQVSEPEPKTVDSILEQILSGNLSGQPDIIPYGDSKQSEPIKFETPVLKKEKKKQQTPFLNEELSGFVHEGGYSTRTGATIDEIMKQDEVFEEAFEIDIRKAVIYNEILRTPYL